MTRTITSRLARAALASALLIGVSAPAFAGDGHHSAYSGGWRGGYGGNWYYPVMPYQGVYTVTVPTTVVQQDAPPPQPAYPPQGYYPAPDPEWQRMMDRCSEPPRADNGVGGAVIGGIVGGVVGNRVADGDRTLGTVVGGALGAVAGAAIDKAEDKGAEQRLREECDAWYASHQPPQGYPYPGGYPYQGGYPAAAYGYPGYVMVPVMLPAQQKPCVETTTVTEEWVDEPVRTRTIPRRAPHRDKRVKEKRVYTG